MNNGGNARCPKVFGRHRGSFLSLIKISIQLFVCAPRLQVSSSGYTWRLGRLTTKNAADCMSLCTASMELMFETALNSYGGGRGAVVLECILQSSRSLPSDESGKRLSDGVLPVEWITANH
jgi:hypothetical protein